MLAPIPVRPKIARFNIKHLDFKEGAKLTLVVSMDNINQTGKGLENFLGLVNEYRGKITELDIIVSCYLQRHYRGEITASQLFNEWCENNRAALEDFTRSSSIVLKCKPWRPFIETPEFKDALKFVEKLFDENEEFQTTVSLLAGMHTHKRDFKAAKSYLLEESAFCKIYKGVVCYPSTGLNAAVSYVVKHYNEDLVFCGYMIVPQKTPSASPSPSPDQNTALQRERGNGELTTSKDMARLMRRFGINNTNDQKECFTQVVGLMQNFNLNKNTLRK